MKGGNVVAFKQSGPTPKVNIRRDGVEEVADAVKLALLAHKTPFDVYLDGDGFLRMDNVNLSKRVNPLPAEWLVGRFTRAVKVDDLEDALVAHLNEIRQRKQEARA